MATAPKGDFIYSDAPAPHLGRRRRIATEHRDVRGLMGRNPLSAAWIAGLVAAQWAICYLLRDSNWLLILLVAYAVGAFVNHALYVLIHECAHNLVAKRQILNKVLGIACDLALFFPSALAFRKYHLLHHKHLGHLELDPDIISPAEANLIGKSAWRKTVWVFLLPVSQALRPYKVPSVRIWDGWIVTNVIVVAAVDMAIVYAFGGKALAYLGLSTLFALGLHPLGGRWVQEHYVTQDEQETYSYYGILNRVCFNMGFHNEHHDFPNVPWNNLPKLTRLAPEEYRTLKSYRSWIAVLLNFLFNPAMSGYSRVVRADSK